VDSLEPESVFCSPGISIVVLSKNEPETLFIAQTVRPLYSEYRGAHNGPSVLRALEKEATPPGYCLCCVAQNEEI